jgi:hypothetical protein
MPTNQDFEQMYLSMVDTCKSQSDTINQLVKIIKVIEAKYNKLKGEQTAGFEVELETKKAPQRALDGICEASN